MAEKMAEKMAQQQKVTIASDFIRSGFDLKTVATILSLSKGQIAAAKKMASTPS